MEEIRKQRLQDAVRTAYNRSDLVVVPFFDNPWACPYDADQVDFAASYTIEEKGKIGDSVFGRLFYWHEDVNGWLLELSIERRCIHLVFPLGIVYGMRMSMIRIWRY